MIANGEKREEYREIKPYWEKRLLDYKGLSDYYQKHLYELRIKKTILPPSPGNREYLWRVSTRLHPCPFPPRLHLYRHALQMRGHNNRQGQPHMGRTRRRIIHHQIRRKSMITETIYTPSDLHHGVCEWCGEESDEIVTTNAGESASTASKKKSFTKKQLQETIRGL